MARGDKIKVGNDPNNKEWAEDTSRFGYKMLEKMGWSEGKGLGKNKDGITEHVKAVKKFDSRGIGADAKTSQQLYTAKTVAFSDILSKLAAEYGAAKPETEDKPAKKSSKLSTVSSSDDSSSDEETEKKKTNRVHFTRRARSKNASSYSKEDLSAILVNQKHVEKVHVKSVTNVEQETKYGNILAVSKVSVADYFKDRMASLNKRKAESSSDDSDSSEDEAPKKKKKKVNSDSDDSSDDEKTKKKKKKQIVEDTTSSSDSDSSSDEGTKKKKKRSK